MKKLAFIFFVFCSLSSFGNKNYLRVKEDNFQKGQLSFGVRSTISLFSQSGNYKGIGAGWQVRYRIAEHLNSEWFADWIVTDIGGLGSRYDSHIGESMLIYPFSNPNAAGHFTPYVLGGFCGDYTKIEANIFYNDYTKTYSTNTKDRWSFATQLGLGTHYNFTKWFDISFTTQYILHAGKDIHSDIETNSLGEKYLHIHQQKGNNLEGHLFFTINANFVIADIIK